MTSDIGTHAEQRCSMPHKLLVETGDFSLIASSSQNDAKSSDREACLEATLWSARKTSTGQSDFCLRSTEDSSVPRYLIFLTPTRPSDLHQGLALLLTTVPHQIFVKLDFSLGIHHNDRAAAILERSLAFAAFHGLPGLLHPRVPLDAPHKHGAHGDNCDLVPCSGPVHDHDLSPVLRKDVQRSCFVDGLWVDGVVRARNLLDIVDRAH